MEDYQDANKNAELLEARTRDVNRNAELLEARIRELQNNLEQTQQAAQHAAQ